MYNIYIIHVTSKIVNLYLKIKDEVILFINILFLLNIIFFIFFTLSIYRKYYIYFISTLGQRIFNFKMSDYSSSLRFVVFLKSYY